MPLEAGGATDARAFGVSGAVRPPAHPSCDPLGFTLAMLTARGALVEPGAHTAVALLPPELASELQLPEDCTLGLEGSDTVVPCGLGSSLLDRLVEQACSGLAVAHASLELEPPRAGRARSLGEAFVVRNGVTELLECLPGSVDYLLLVANWVAEADDRFEGLALGAVCAADAGQPDPELELALVSELRAGGGPRCAVPRTADGETGEADAARTFERLRGLVAERARQSVQPLVAGVARRHAREHAGIAEYFEAMLAELAGRKRRLDPETLASRMMAVVADRDGKLCDLRQRFALRVRLSPVVLASFRLPCIAAKVRVRRRQLERVVTLRLPALAQHLDRLACDACGGFTQRPAVCDRRVHLLCERCAPDARGRLACPACG